MVPSKRRKRIRDWVRARSMISRKKVDWEKITNLIVADSERMAFRWVIRAAILANEEVPNAAEGDLWSRKRVGSCCCWER